VSSLQLVLASSSPRRQEILGRLGIHPLIEPADIDETPLSGEAAPAYVERLAVEKAATASRQGVVVLAADTAVVLDGVILGKPDDPDHAAEMLRSLSGRSHEVVSGVAVVVGDDRARAASAVERTVVTISALSDSRIAWYARSGEPDDKAGAYGLQGAAGIFADRIDGSATNVIGLPLPLVDQLFAEVGLDLLDFRA
jgi:septum formation protein